MGFKQGEGSVEGSFNCNLFITFFHISILCAIETLI